MTEERENLPAHELASLAPHLNKKDWEGLRSEREGGAAASSLPVTHLNSPEDKPDRQSWTEST